MTGYCFIDVETPNRQNNRICSIGIERTNNYGKLEYSNHFYVNPEQGFDSFNIDIHGINPSDVKDAPSFLELWESEITNLFSDATLVAHNVSFDLNVLGKALDSYGITKPTLKYICTQDIAKHFIQLEHYGLVELCSYYGINLDEHHNALADARACREVFWRLVEEFALEEHQGNLWMWRDYDPLSQKTSNCDSMLTDLYGITLGINADQKITPEESQGLTEWMVRNSNYRNTKYMHRAFELLEKSLDDGVITQQEQNEILNFTRPFVINDHNNENTIKTQAIIGVLRGISCDKKINKHEAKTLQEWLEDIHIQDNTLIDKLSVKLNEALSDGIIDTDEENELLELCYRIIDPVSQDSINKQASAIVYAGQKFVLTGNFTHGSKKEIENVIKERGGEIAASVSGKVAYVVVGGEGSDAYSCGNYGTKVKKAMELQDKGKPIQIIQEAQLYE